MLQSKPRLLDPEKRVKQLIPFIESLPLFTPRQIARNIRKFGYKGQEPAVKSAALMAHRHIFRLKKLYIDQINVNLLPPKINMLFVGPTGCGKTFLIEILFKNILKLPTVVVDMTTYSETGYVGQDVGSILTRLVYASDLNPVIASIGIVCLDEFDKIASGQNNAVFAGAGTTKDVSGLGVQRELLKMLESADITIPMELSHSDYAPKIMISTRDIPFIACGAFSGLKGMLEQRERQIGFGRKVRGKNLNEIAVDYTVDEVEMTKNFLNYGFLPELMGRFKRIIPFHALTEEHLSAILNENLIKKYKNEFKLKGIELKIANQVIKKIIKESLKKETGARGIESSLFRFLENAAFDAYSETDVKLIEFYLAEDKIEYRFN
jgi:ATP-dependent Clp protease ATP-binding subunit ClpX